MRGSCIAGWGYELPDRVVTNEELGEELGVTSNWIYERTGILERRRANAEESVASMATAAARSAIERADLRAQDIDLVLVATCTAPSPIPAVAPLVQAELGALRAGAFDVNAACSGFIHALACATSHVACGWAENVVVCGTEKLSDWLDPGDVGSSILFGDGAGAVVVSAGQGTRVGPFAFGADGAQGPLLQADDRKIQMDGRAVYRHAVERMSESIRAVSALSGIDPNGVDHLIVHQANGRILEAVADRLAFPKDKMVSNIERVGNTSAASIPIALAQAADAGVLADEDLLLLAAFGAGFVWAAGLLVWGPVSIDVEPEIEELARV